VVKNMHIHISIPSADFLAIVLHTNQKALNAEALPEKVRRHAGSGRIAPLILQLGSRSVEFQSRSLHTI
jgi:hypothetical protein